MPIDLDRLQTTLLTSGLQQKDKPLFQVINQLITSSKDLQAIVNAFISNSGGGGGALASLGYLTSDDETANLPNSRELLAGTNISFDDSVSGERTVSATGGGSGVDHVVMSDGAMPIPSPVDDGFGNFIYIEYSA